MEAFISYIKELFHKIPKSFYFPILLLVCGTIFFVIGLMQLLGQANTQEVSSVSTQEIKATASANTTFGLIKVDVEGSVAHPGVYSLANSARVQDALVAAGGLSAVADRVVVERRINLAAKLSDGMKIYIPDVSQKSTEDSSGSSTDYLGAQVHLIDLNQATADELDSLPGVGPATTQKIISARPFSSVSELLSKKVVSNSVYEKIKTLVTTY